VLEIELQVDGFGQPVEENFHVGSIGRGLTDRDFGVRSKEAALSGVVRAFLRPVNLPAIRINRDPDAPLPGVAAGACLTLARVHEGFDRRPVEVRAHDAHPLAVAPVELAILQIEVELLGRERAPLGNNDRAVPPVEVGALDGPVVQVRDTHVGPVDVPGVGVDGDTVG
jgi:hypothetical protein